MGVDLDVGDFVYQSDQKLFMVVTEETEDGYMFAVHGWREIDSDRLEQYLDEDGGKLYEQQHIKDALIGKTDEEDEVVQMFERLEDLFKEYEDIDVSTKNVDNFMLEDT